jgi:hypothetical protein
MWQKFCAVGAVVVAFAVASPLVAEPWRLEMESQRAFLDRNIDSVREAVAPFDLREKAAKTSKTKAEAVISGTVGFVSTVTFLSDGTPVRFVGINVASPLVQQVLTACLGSANAFVACALPLGKKVEFTNWVLATVVDGDQEGFNLLIATKLKTPR